MTGQRSAWCCLILMALACGCSPADDDGRAPDAVAADRSGTSASPAASNAPAAAAATAPATAPAPAPQSAAEEERLYGTWVANEVGTPMGDVKLQLTFREEGPVKILAWSELPLVGQVKNRQAPYQIHDRTLESEALRGGTSVRYWFNDRDQLVIEYKDGKTVTFRRK